jgi:3-oxoacyl-[acyl-carrier protein] reductase
MSPEVAIVTGAAQGIGLAIARRLAEDGFTVHAWDRDGAGVAAAADGLRAAGHDVVASEVDVSRRAAVSAACDRAGRVDVAVCAAGAYWPKRFDELDEDDFRRIMEVNLIGVFVVAQEAARRMGPGGRIVPIASRGALGGTGFAHYVASKAAVIGLVRAMAMELRGREIGVNAVAPGFTDTAMTRRMPPDEYARAVALEPRGRAADPAEIADAVSFFASRRSRFATGQTLFVDGGKSLGGLGL